MITMATAIQASCREKKCHDEPNLSWAITDDALYSITTPKKTITTMVENRTQSVFNLCAISFSAPVPRRGS